MYVRGIPITWDPEKSEWTRRERGLDFRFAAEIFRAFTLDWFDGRRDYGELRVISVGTVLDEVLTVVHTTRVSEDGQLVRRIISARRSNRNERNAFRAAAQKV